MSKDILSKSNQLSDPAIAQISKLLQLAILTGTDVMDNLRMLRLVEKDSNLYPDPAYLETFEKQISGLMEKIPLQNSNFS